MPDACIVADCDRDVHIRKTGECQRHYNSRYYEQHRKPPAVRAESCVIGGDVGYLTAHQRVYRYRGKASEHTCSCGAPAVEWSYRGGSPWELEGERMERSGRLEHYRWSTNPGWYDALCHSCHVLRDRGSTAELCPKGHDRTGQRDCRECQLERMRARVTCEVCGLDFAYHSMPKHRRTHSASQ